MRRAVLGPTQVVRPLHPRPEDESGIWRTAADLTELEGSFFNPDESSRESGDRRVPEPGIRYRPPCLLGSDLIGHESVRIQSLSWRDPHLPTPSGLTARKFTVARDKRALDCKLRPIFIPEAACTWISMETTSLHERRSRAPRSSDL